MLQIFSNLNGNQNYHIINYNQSFYKIHLRKIHCKNTVVLIHVLCFPPSILVVYVLFPAPGGKKAIILINSTYLSPGQVAQYCSHSPQMF